MSDTLEERRQKVRNELNIWLDYFGPNGPGRDEDLSKCKIEPDIEDGITDVIRKAKEKELPSGATLKMFIEYEIEKPIEKIVKDRTWRLFR